MFNLEAVDSFTEHNNKIFRERTGQDFTTFYKKYYPKLIFYTSKFCNDIQKAEDVTTDSFLVAFEKIEKYDKDKSQFSTWLFTIARNIMLQEIKIDKKSVSMDVDLDEDGTTMKDFICEEEYDDSFDQLNIKKVEIIKKHISKLKEPYRKVIEMREIQKMQYKDISERLNLNPSTVKSQIRNGRALLVKATKKEFDILDDMYL